MDKKFEIGKTYPLRNGGTGQPLKIEDRGPYPMQVLLRTPDGHYFLEWATAEGLIYWGKTDGNDLLLPAIGKEAASE